MPVTSKPTREATILAAAADLFAERGYAAVGVDDIGAAIGVSGPAIYRYFPGKEAILVAVLQSTTRQLADLLVPLEAPMSADEAEAVMRRAVAASLDHRAGLATLFREERRPLGDDAWAPIVADAGRIARYSGAALDVLNPGLDELGAAVRGAAVRGTLIAVAVRRPEVAGPRLAAMVADSAVAVLRTPAAEPTGTGPVPPQPAWRPRRTRRDDILAAALRLFRARSFHEVGVNEIGAAAGTTGPGIYRYYRNKLDILVDAYDRGGRRMAAGVEEALAGAGSAGDALGRLARSYCAVAMADMDLLVVTSREDGSLPDGPDDDDGGGADRFRVWRDLRELWGSVLAEVRPELRRAEVELLVRTAFSLMDQAVQVAEGHPDRVPDIAAVAEAHLLSG